MSDTNSHRKDKHPFQAYLTAEEKDLIDKTKASKGIEVRTDRELIVKLCKKWL